MRVVMATYGSRGDVEPLLALGLALQARGVDVQLGAPPDFGELAAGLGLPLTPVGSSVRRLATSALGRGAPNKPLPVIAAELTASTYEALAPLVDGAAAVVGAGVVPVEAGARAAAEKAGVPYVGTSFSSCFVPSPFFPPVPWPGQAELPADADPAARWDANAVHVHGIFGAPVNAHRASIGLPPTANIRDLVLGEQPFLAADPVLGPWPTDVRVLQTGAWTRPDDRPLPADLEAFLDAGDPPVYVGFGSMPLRDPEATGRAAGEAVRAHGRRLVLGSGWAELADDLDDCVVVGEVNQQALFRRVAAVVHHGGAGTTTTTARAGTPQVIVPQVADQPYWGERVTRLGIGVRHDGPLPTAASLSAALAVALAPEVAARAAVVAGTIRGDGAEVAARLLLEVVGSGAAG